MKLRTVFQLAQLIFLILFAFVLCFYFSLLFNFWSEYGFLPDSLSHYDIADFTFRYFPHTSWINQIGCGTPFLLLWPKGLYLLEAGLRALTHWDMQAILFGAIFGSIFLAGIWTALAIRVATKSWLLSLLTLPFFYGSSLLWFFRNYGRGVAYHFVPLTVLALVWYLERPSKKRKIILILVAGICATFFHPMIGLIVLATAGCFLLDLKRIKELFSVIIPLVLIASTYYLPLKVVSGSHSKLFPGPKDIDSFSTTVKGLFYESLSPFSALVACVVLIALAIFARKKLKPYHKKLLLSSILAIFGLFIYIFGVYFSFLSFIYASAFAHSFMIIYLLPFLSLITAVSLKILTQDRPRTVLWLAGGLVFTFLLLLSLYPHKDKAIQFKMIEPVYETVDWKVFEDLLGPPPGENEYHYFGYFHPNFLPLYFNVRYNIPDFGRSPSRGLGTKWWSLATDSFPREGKEKFFYIDWYGLHYLYYLAGYPPDLVENSEIFTIKTYDEKGNPFGGYFNHPKPILEANPSPSVLFIGQDYTYEEWIEALSWANINSSFLIPVKGPQTLDKISPEELAKFDVVWFYKYKYHFRYPELSKLAKFVREGGGLVIDTGFGLDAEAERLPDPFPITQTYTADVRDSWQIKKEDHPVNQEVRFTHFASPIYREYGQEYPWKISTVGFTDIKPWAKAIMTTQNKPIVVVGQLGAGRVVWTGFNLPYHLAQFKNEQEALFLKNMLLWAAKDKQESPVQFTSQFIHPEKREVQINSPARGVIFRENFFPNWKVKLGRKRQRLYKAGPDLMYLPLPQDQPYPAQVTFYYQKSPLEMGTTVLALLTVLILLVAFFKKDFLAKLLNP